jgi:hypothetical protein
MLPKIKIEQLNNDLYTVIKTEKSKILYVYRKNFATDKYEIYLKKKPNGTFK